MNITKQNLIRLLNELLEELTEKQIEYILHLVKNLFCHTSD